MKLELINSGYKSTLKRPLNFTGLAPIKKDVESTIIVSPSEEGINFVYGKERIPANFNFLKKTNSGKHTSQIGNSKVTISQTEHLLAALSGLKVDSVDIELGKSNEIPDIGYSADEFTNQILRAGKRRTDAKRQTLVVKEEIYFNDTLGSLAILRPGKKVTISVLIQFPSPIEKQFFQINLTPRTFRKEIAWARSFIRRGCDDDIWNAARRELPILPKDITKSPIPVFDKAGNWIVSPTKWDEPVRHKTLDLIGDLALLGYPIQGDIMVIRPGHDFNRRLVKFLGNLLENGK